MDQKIREQLLKRIEKSNRERRELLEECVAVTGADAPKYIDKGIPQSELFMVEIIPWLHKYYFSAPTNAVKTILDIGPQSFGGTALLNRIHSTKTFNKLKLEITALDIHDDFELVQKMNAPDIEFIVQDIFDIEDRTWDTVICSHVIEHVPNPEKFLKQCQELANDQVIVACPWAEDPLTTFGHINTINKALIKSVGAEDLLIYTNYNWGKNRDVCIFKLPGRRRSDLKSQKPSIKRAAGKAVNDGS